MMDNGAKNILLVSRNAESHPDAVELVRTAKTEGCNLQVRNCDVSSDKGLVELLTYCSSASIPPIRGVINCAMVLDVSQTLYPSSNSITSPAAILTGISLAGHDSGKHDI